MVLRKGGAANACGSASSRPDDDLDAFEKQTQAHGVKTRRLKDPEPTVSEMVAFEDPKGTLMEVFKRAEPQTQKFPIKGIVPHKIGHVAFIASTSSSSPNSIATCWASASPTGWATSSRSCAAASTITPSI